MENLKHEIFCVSCFIVSIRSSLSFTKANILHGFNKSGFLFNKDYTYDKIFKRRTGRNINQDQINFFEDNKSLYYSCYRIFGQIPEYSDDIRDLNLDQYNIIEESFNSFLSKTYFNPTEINKHIDIIKNKTMAINSIISYINTNYNQNIIPLMCLGKIINDENSKEVVDFGLSNLIIKELEKIEKINFHLIHWKESNLIEIIKFVDEKLIDDEYINQLLVDITPQTVFSQTNYIDSTPTILLLDHRYYVLQS